MDKSCVGYFGTTSQPPIPTPTLPCVTQRNPRPVLQSRDAETAEKREQNNNDVDGDDLSIVTIGLACILPNCSYHL